jgi:GT2 family glycosyltransferase/glycosyltransferase involved in cell wall biosynthesis
LAASKKPPAASNATSAAFVVLGMHRSGTSALAHLLHDAGADLGERLLPGSAGNELGHWEDAFAVETNERLLAALGHRWDDVRPLPRKWQDGDAAREARARIIDYVRSTRLRHPAWALKDPRMCLLADLWLDALAQAGCKVSALLLARHPQEVAASLAARDGMDAPRAHLMWARHMLDAERATRAIPRIALTYDTLLDAPLALVERVRALPGGAVLHAPAKGATPVQPKARHHRAGTTQLPAPIDALWTAFAATDGGATLDPATMDRCSAALDAADRLYAPVLAEASREQDILWQRTARAEAALAEGVLSAPDDTQALASLAEGVERVLAAVSEDLVRMQAAHAEALATASTLSGEAGLARDLVPALAQVRDGVADLGARVVEAIGVELRRMQEAQARAIASASELSGKAGLADDIAPSLGQVRESVSDLGTRMTDAIGVELRRMQEEHSKAIAAASGLSAQAAIAQNLAPGVAQLREAVTGEMRRLHEENLASAALARQRESEAAALQSRLDQAARDASGAQAELRERDAMLASLQHQLPLLQADADLLRQIRGSRSWRLTRPLRFAGRVARGAVTRADRERIQRWWALQLASTRFLPRSLRERKWREGRGAARVTAEGIERHGAEAAAAPVPVLAAAPAGDRPDVFMWAVIDWHFRIQRPQHLARGLVEAGHRVFYLSNNLVDDAKPGFNIEALDDSGRLFQVFLNASGAPAIYYGTPDASTVAQLRRSVGELMQWADSDGGLCIVQHPFWSDIASRVPGAALLYDCMDHHAGFEDNAPDVLDAEAKLTRAADLLVVTSDWLDRELAGANPNRALIRNAGDFDHFCKAPSERFRDRQGRRIIGYYGAIAEWFDAELVRDVARAYPDCLVLLVGNDTASVGARLADQPNVVLTGEVPYDRLPYYLHAFDLAMLPFKVMPLTLATNPVKVYEYLGAGKPVVSVDLPEIRQFGDLVYRAADGGEFIACIAQALAEDPTELVGRRMAFASEQTWVHRAEELDNAIAALPEPLVSVVVLTYNNLEFTRACLHSLVTQSNWRNLEIIVVDNASSDGTQEFLREWTDAGPGRRVILNDDNLGFSAGNNVGLAAAAGDYLVLLNNDTYVTRNWVRTMVNHLARNPGIGILGPVTNNIGNEARIEVQYADMDAMARAAAAHTRRHAGIVFDIPTVAFFCVAMPRSTYERVGPMDEAFGVGFFEDDDYCRRVEAAGLRVACADDVFIHHHLSASFDALKAERKQELFDRNKAIYEAKWGPWQPHAYRERT